MSQTLQFCVYDRPQPLLRGRIAVLPCLEEFGYLRFEWAIHSLIGCAPDYHNDLFWSSFSHFIKEGQREFLLNNRRRAYETENKSEDRIGNDCCACHVARFSLL